jgi:hypothetical protein
MSFMVLIVGVVVLGLFVAGIVALVVVSTSRNRRRQPTPATTPSLSQAIHQDDRQEILRKLSAGELTKDEAEERLAQLGAPVPEAMPAPPATGSGMSKGCLIALLVTFILGPLLLILLMAALFFGVRVAGFQGRQGNTQEARPVPAAYEEAAR